MRNFNRENSALHFAYIEFSDIKVKFKDCSDKEIGLYSTHVKRKSLASLRRCQGRQQKVFCALQECLPGAAEQVNSWGGGRGEHAKHGPLGGSGGMLPQENFQICTL